LRRITPVTTKGAAVSGAIVWFFSPLFASRLTKTFIRHGESKRRLQQERWGNL